MMSTRVSDEQVEAVLASRPIATDESGMEMDTYPLWYHHPLLKNEWADEFVAMRALAGDLKDARADLARVSSERDEARGERDMANEYIGRAREHINAQLGIRTPFFDDLIVLAVNYALEADDRARETQKTCDEVESECERWETGGRMAPLGIAVKALEAQQTPEAERDALRGQLAACVRALEGFVEYNPIYEGSQSRDTCGVCMSEQWGGQEVKHDSDCAWITARTVLTDLSDAAAEHDRAMRIEGALLGLAYDDGGSSETVESMAARIVDESKEADRG